MSDSNNHFKGADPLLDDNDPVWRLLGRASCPEPDAWFTVRTLARCRHAGLAPESWGFFSVRAWRWALSGGLGFCLALVLLSNHIHLKHAQASNQKNVQEAFEIVASLGSDSDTSTPSSTSSPWPDSL